jgi:hypothetical protein
VVKNTLDTTRAGRLQVWIAELGSGDTEDSKNWYTVSYASPFGGMTHQPDNLSGVKLNSFQYVQHTYGFWAVPPDIGNVVLVTFINGDPTRGYWFACVYNKLGVGMVPAIGGGDNTKFDAGSIADEKLKKALTSESVWPLSEFNENDGENVSGDFVGVKKPPHEWQAMRYVQQGLDRDPDRGAVSSSSQRNIPGSVYGWSSPGRKLVGDSADNPGLQAKVDSGDITEGDMFALGRKGGHHMVMDDGDFYGKSNLMRFRSASGHQILMDDTNQMMHIINSEGTCWIELAGSGHMHIYTSAGFNVRSGGDLNFHSDTNINLHAEGSINAFSGAAINLNAQTIAASAADTATVYGATVQVGSSGALNFSAGAGGSFSAGGAMTISGAPLNLNSGSGPTVSKPADIPKMVHDDTTLNSGTGLWEIKAGALSTIVTIAPTHEPWKREGGASESGSVAG